MLASFFAWWTARMSELLPVQWTGGGFRARDGIVVDAQQGVSAAIRRNGRSSPLPLGAAARQSRRNPVLVRPRADVVLTKHHTVPSIARRQMGQMLRHEIGRITPFPADALYWRWDGHPNAANRSRFDVTLTLVPRIALAEAFAALDEVGLKPNFVEVGPTDRPVLLSVGDSPRESGTLLRRGLIGLCAGLAVVALALPVVRQSIALYRADAAIAALQPTIKQVEALRRGAAAGDAGRDILAKEMERTGDLLQTLATVTRILPDDSFLTDFALRDRQMTLSGRSASAPRLITGLSADPAIRGAAFAAPVTRIEGATADVFSIRAEIAK
jgi:general secretion pathway protein L